MKGISCPKNTSSGPEVEARSERGKPAALLALPAAPRPSRALGGLYVDAPRLLLRALRDRQLEHAVHLRGLDGLGIGTLGESETTQERAAGTLNAAVALAVGLLLGRALATHRQPPLFGRDFDVLAINARHIGGHDEALGLFADVDLRNPADVRLDAVGVLVLGLIEALLKAAHERPGLVPKNRHEKSPLRIEVANLNCARRAVDPDVCSAFAVSSGCKLGHCAQVLCWTPGTHIYGGGAATVEGRLGSRLLVRK